MSNNVFDFITEASKEQSKLRLALQGPSGSGKTYSAINILMHMGCEKILVIDTEQGSAAKYSNCFARKFDTLDNKFWKSNYDPRRLIEVLKAVGEKYDGIVVDSLTHFWMGTGGFLTIVDQIAKKSQARGGKYDSFGAWKEADPIYNHLIQTILDLPCHFAACLRAKSEYEDQVGTDGKKKKVKVGLAAQMREGFEYEFDVEGMLDMNHNFIVGKTRCNTIDGQMFEKPGENIAKPLLAWLTDGTPAAKLTPAPANDNGPDTQPTPSVAAVTISRETFAEKLTASPDEATLKAVGAEIAQAKKDGLLGDDTVRTLNDLYRKRVAELRPKAAAS